MSDDDLQLCEDDADPSMVRVEKRLKVLEELTEIGMVLARRLIATGEVQLESCEKPPAKVRDPAEMFALLSRAIRLTLALEAKTETDLRVLKVGAGKACLDRLDAKVRRHDDARFEHRQRVQGLVADVAFAECRDIEDFHNLHEALEERLDHDDAYVDFLKRPLRETIERLCKDLTLTPDWTRWDGEGWLEESPPPRPIFSIFNTPSARKRLGDHDEVLSPWCLHNGRAAAAEELEAPGHKSGDP